MKAIRFLPLVYIVGVDGFVFFAPYILLLLTLAYAIRIYRARQLQLLPTRRPLNNAKSRIAFPPAISLPHPLPQQ
jgi:hypothetical protein